MPWLKVELANVKQKVEVLQNKSKLRKDPLTKSVFVDRVKSPLELTVEHNSRMLLKALGSSGMRVAGNSRIVRAGDNRRSVNNNNENQSSQAAAANTQKTGAANSSVTPDGTQQSNAQPEKSTGSAATPPSVSTPTRQSTGEVTSSVIPPKHVSPPYPLGGTLTKNQQVPGIAKQVASPATSPPRQGLAGLTQGVSDLLGAAAVSLGFSTPAAGKAPPGTQNLNNSFVNMSQDVSDSQLLGAVGGFAPASPAYESEFPDPTASRNRSPKVHRNGRTTRSSKDTTQSKATSTIDANVDDHSKSKGRGKR